MGESCRTKSIQLEKKIQLLTTRLENFETSMSETQEELMSRHGLLVILEVCVLGLIMFWCTPVNKPGNRNPPPGATTSTRRLSLDTLKTEKLKVKQNKTAPTQPNRRKSIEMGGLCTVGSMVNSLESTTKKKVKRKKRRKEEASGHSNSSKLQNVELSDTDVYLTYHGGHDIITPTQHNRKRSNSWSQQIDQLVDDRSPLGTEDRLHRSPLGTEDRLHYPGDYSLPTAGFRTSEPTYWETDRQTEPAYWETDRQKHRQTEPYWEKHVADVLTSTRFLVHKVTSQQNINSRPEITRKSTSNQEIRGVATSKHTSPSNQDIRPGTNSKHTSPSNQEIRTGATSKHTSPSNQEIRGVATSKHTSPSNQDIRTGATSKHTSPSNQDIRGVATSKTGYPNIETSNMYSLLDEDDECTDTDMPALLTAVPDLVSTPSRKIQRSKSTSPSRNTINMIKKQKVMFKSFKPENADWLQQ